MLPGHPLADLRRWNSVINTKKDKPTSQQRREQSPRQDNAPGVHAMEPACVCTRASLRLRLAAQVLQVLVGVTRRRRTTATPVTHHLLAAPGTEGASRPPLRLELCRAPAHSLPAEGPACGETPAGQPRGSGVAAWT